MKVAFIVYVDIKGDRKQAIKIARNKLLDWGCSGHITVEPSSVKLYNNSWKMWAKDLVERLDGRLATDDSDSLRMLKKYL